VDQLNPAKIVATHLSDEVIRELKAAAKSLKNKYLIIADDGLILGV
jgi:hypothetical protein